MRRAPPPGAPLAPAPVPTFLEGQTMGHSDLMHEAADAVAPVLRDMRTRVTQASDRTLSYVRDEPLRSAIAAAAVGTLVFALWHLLSSRNSR